MRKKWIWWGAAAAVVLLMVIVMNLRGGALPVELATVTKGDLAKYVEEMAVVHLQNETSLYALQSGQIIQIAGSGDTVNKNDVLVKMDDTQAVLQIKALKAKKQLIEAQYTEAAKPKSAAEINALKSQLKSSQAAYDEAKTAAANSKKLYDEEAISSAEYQNSLSQLAAAEAALATAQSNLAVAQEGLSAGIRQQYEAQLADIQAQIDIYENTTAEFTLKAPYDGTVLKTYADVGSVAQAGTLLLDFGGKQGFILKSDILAVDIASVRKGAAVLINNDDLGITDWQGVVESIAPVASDSVSDLGIEQKRVEVKISLPEDKDIPLKSGYETNIKIIVDSRENVLTLDKRAVFQYQGEDCVFVNENGKAVLRQIQTGLENDDLVEVLTGLSEGEQVVLSPDESLANGMKIKSAVI